MLTDTFRKIDAYQKVWSVQPFNVHRSDLLAAEPISIDVLKVGDPFKFDIFKFISDFDPPRNTLRVWETQHSDIEGCITVVSPFPRRR